MKKTTSFLKGLLLAAMIASTPLFGASTATDVIDGVSSSTAFKAPVRGVTTTNITLSGLSAISTVEGSMTPASGDRFLLTGQTTASQNLIYIARSGTWEVAADSDGARDLRDGTVVKTQGGVMYHLTTSDPIVPATTSLTWVRLDTLADTGDFSSVQTITALKALTGMADGQVVNVACYYTCTTPDGGGGPYRYDAASSATANDCTIVDPDAAGTGRWELVYSGAINIKRCGAVGDGVADDTAEIQAAIDAVPSPGGHVYAPTGSYLFSSTLTLPTSIVIRLTGDGDGLGGAAWGTRFVKAASLNGAAIIVQTDATVIENLKIQGAVGNGGDGIVVKAARVALRDVHVAAMGNDGIRIGTDAGGENVNLWYLEHVKVLSNGRDGLRISEGSGGLADASAGTCNHIDARSNTGAGVYLGNTQLNTFVGGAYQSNGTYGIHISTDAEYNAFFGGDVEANTTAQVRIDSGAENNQFRISTLLQSQFSIGTTTENNYIDVIDYTRLPHGLKFPPVQVATTDANTLDDYEEGAITATVIGTTAAGAGTYTNQWGSYAKIGAMVHAQIYLVWTAHTGTGNMKLSGLPFTAGAASTYGYASCAIGFDSNIALTAGNIMGAYVESGAISIDLVQRPTGGGATAAIPIDAAGTLAVSCTYRAAS